MENVKFWHVGVLVNDLDESLKFYLADPGYEEGSLVKEHVCFPDEICPIGGGIDVNVARVTVSGLCYELIQPLKEGIYQDRALKARGELLHHTAYFVDDKHDEIVEALLAAGGEIEWAVRDKKPDGTPFNISFVRAASGGMIFELVGDKPFC